MSMQYSPFYMFLSYLQIGTLILTFILAVIGVVGGVLAIKALLIYIKKNKVTTDTAAPAREMPVKQQAVLPEPNQEEDVEIVAEATEAAVEETAENEEQSGENKEEE